MEPYEDGPIDLYCNVVNCNPGQVADRLKKHDDDAGLICLFAAEALYGLLVRHLATNEQEEEQEPE